MPDASYVQSNFQGGEWSPYFQGRYDHPKYRQSMKLCRNALPIEEGACPRRSGTAFRATTRAGVAGRVISFDIEQVNPFQIELTDGHLRLYAGNSLVFTPDVQPITSLNTANPVQAAVGGPVTWASGDSVQFFFNGGSTTANAAILRNRQFVITMIGDTDFTLTDPITGATIDGSTIGWDPAQFGLQVGRVLDFATPYTSGMWKKVVRIQDETTAILLHGSVSPRALDLSPSSSSNQFANFTFAPINFLDGPYLDPVKSSIATPSATSGIITVSVGWQAWSATATYTIGDHVTYSGLDYQSLIAGNLNHIPSSSPLDWKLINAGNPVGPSGFVATDIGRLMRLYSEPAPWDKTHVYAVGDSVLYGGIYYTMAVKALNAAKTPTIYPQFWAINPAAANWTWGKITAINSPISVQLQILGDPLLYTNTVNVWRLGAYSDTTGYPTCGTFHEGRLWLSGAIKNRIDGSVANGDSITGSWDFSPTQSDGTVEDANAIDYTFRAPDKNNVVWMEPDHAGIICGTLKGEWLVQASQLNDPLTPTSIQAHRVTRYGCAQIQPVRTGLTLAFVEGFQRKVLEYFPDVFTGRFTAPNLTEAGKHMTKTGVQELAYTKELAPVVWARTGDNRLIGATYKRETLMSSQPANFVGWHQHSLGSGRVVESISSGPRPDGAVDQLWMVTNDPATNIRHVEVLQDIFDQGNSIYQSWFVDDGITPSGVSATGTAVTFYGLWHLNGHRVAVFIGGLDLGDWLVANGAVTVPFGINPLFTKAYLDTLSAQGIDFGGLATVIETVTVVPPIPPIAPASANGWILGYVGSPVQITDLAQSLPVPDWANNMLYVKESQAGGSEPSPWRKFNLTTGAELGEYMSVDGDANSPVAFDGTFIYTMDNGNTNYVYKINPANFTTVKRFGTAPDIFADMGDQSGIMPQANSLSILKALDAYLLAVGGINDTATVLNVKTMQFAGHLFSFPNTGNRSGRYGMAGLSTDDGAGNYSATGYIAWNKNDGLGGPTTAINLYRTRIRTTLQSALGSGGGLLGLFGGSSSPTPYRIGADTYGSALVWDPAIQYQTGDIVQSTSNAGLGSSAYFIALEPSLGAIPFILPSLVGVAYEGFMAWKPLGADTLSGTQSPTGVGTGALLWDAGVTYYLGDVTTYNGVPVRCAVATSTGDVPARGILTPSWVFVPNGYINTKLIKTTGLLAASVDPSWVSINFAGMVYDSVDNNIIMHVNTSDPVLQKTYVIKVNSSNLSVMWKVATNAVAMDVISMPLGRVSTGVYAFLADPAVAGARTVYVINTLTGTFTTQTVKGVVPGQGQFMDGVGGVIYLISSYTNAAGTPAPLNQTPALFTSKWSVFWPGSGAGANTFQGNTTSKSRDTVGVAIGFSFTSQWQILRPNQPQEAGAANGPAFAKKKRSMQYGAQFDGTGVGGDLKIGTSFDHMRPVNFNSEGERVPAVNTLYSGIAWDMLDDDYSYDSEIALQITRPFPVTLTALGGFLNTQDK